MQLSLLERVTSKVRGHYRELTDAQIVENLGVKLHVDRALLKDNAIVRALLFNRHERTEADLVKYAVRPDDKVLELGAGLGFITIKCATICGPANVVTFEGNPAMFNLLKRNLELNGCDVDARQAVVSLDGGPVNFQISDSMVSSSLYNRGSATDSVQESASFRTLVAELAPSVIIMDIEGSEVDLLGTIDLPSVRAIGVEVHPQIVGDAAVTEMTRRLEAQGFHLDETFPSQYSRHLYVRQ